MERGIDSEKGEAPQDQAGDEHMEIQLLVA